MSASTAPAARAGAAPHAVTTTLRRLLDSQRGSGSAFALEDAVALLVPLCLELKERHKRGETLYVHPSCIVRDPSGTMVLRPDLATPPQSPNDLAAVPPELRSGAGGGSARASVFSVGAMLYEAVTGAHVGPGMRRPREIAPQLPELLEVILTKALIADPSHRPDDLGALASALHQMAPRKSLAPPTVDIKNLDANADFELDVRFSLLPPATATAPSVTQMKVDMPMGIGLPVAAAAIPTAPTSKRAVDATTALAELKARLESDPRPRYVVNKSSMDHGPFSAVELLQQVANHTFAGTDTLRDELSGEAKPIADWEEFAPFAEHAGRHRQRQAESREVVRLEQEEKKTGIAKFILGGALLATLLVVAGAWWAKSRGSRKEGSELSDDPSALDLTVDGGLSGGKHARGGRGGHGGGGFPAGMSYEAALASNVQEVNMGGAQGAPDLSNAQLSAPMNNTAFLNSCGVPDSMKVTVKVAVKNGRAVGVSVYPNPANPGVASCIDRHVRGLSWPSHPKMDSLTTNY